MKPNRTVANPGSGVFELEVVGPWELPGWPRAETRRIDRALVAEFWRFNHHVTARIGCYVLASRTGAARAPVYIGKTRASFKAEVFTPRNLDIYNAHLEDGAAVPEVVLLMAPPWFSDDAGDVMGAIEWFLISAAKAAHPTLANARSRGRGSSWLGAGHLVRFAKGRALDRRRLGAMLGL